MTDTIDSEAVESVSSSGLEDEPTTRVRLRDLASVDRLTQLQFGTGTALLATTGYSLSVAATTGSALVAGAGALAGGVGLVHYREVSRALEDGGAA